MKWRRRRGRVRGAGASVFGFGGNVSWEPGTDERDVVRELVVDLQAHRALSAPFEYEHEQYLNESILMIKEKLSATLKELNDGSEAEHLIGLLRDACNAYLAATPGPEPRQPIRPHFEVALQALRESFRVVLTYMGAGDHGLKKAAELARSIPTEVRSLGATVIGDPVGEVVHVVEPKPPGRPPSLGR